MEIPLNSSVSDAPTSLSVARRPILDERGRVFGYELLYRHSAGATTCVADGDVASASVLTGAVLDLGLDTLTNGRQAFLNVTRALLLGKLDTLIPPDGVVIELLENVEIDDEVIDTCRDLRAQGYQLALDDFVPGSDAEALLPHATYVKVDVLATPAAVATALAARLAPSGIRLLAEKVESREVYEQTRGAGFTLFQGYYFCRPVTQSSAAVPAQQLAYVRLLAALSEPDLATAEVERLVKQDVSLSVRVRRSVNSAAYPIRTEVRSIGQALFLLGTEPIRTWASVWCLTGLSAGATPELATVALLRARLRAGGGTRPRRREIRGVPRGTVLAARRDAQPDDGRRDRGASAVGDGLGRPAGSSNALGDVLDAVVSYERGEWNHAFANEPTGLTQEGLSESYTSALRWVQEVSRAL